MNFRNVKIDEYLKLKLFFEAYFGDNFFEVEPKHFYWMHNDNPLKKYVANDDEFTAFAAFDNSSIVSCLLYYPVDFIVDGKNYRSCFTTGLLADKQYTAAGGFLLKKHFDRTNYHLSLGDTQVTMKILTKQFGFEYNHNIGRSIMIGSASDTISLLLQKKDLTVDNFKEIYQWEDMTLTSAQKASYVEITSIDALRDHYWNYHKKACRATVSRDKTFMKWRYFDHPHIKYDIISPDSSQQKGIAVIRLERIRGSNMKVARMLECLHADDDHDALCCSVAKYLIDKKAVFLDFFCGSRSYLDRSLRSPFLLEKDHSRFPFPRLFQPLEWRERHSLNATFGKVKNKQCPSVCLDEVYFTKGEGAQDVFVNEEYFTRGF
jgi:hypothetical protein